MKKLYSKPEILFENFSMSTNIAAGCEETPASADIHSCGVDWGKSTIFAEGMTGCISKIIDGSSAHNGLCYHNPSDNYNVFNS